MDVSLTGTVHWSSLASEQLGFIFSVPVSISKSRAQRPPVVTGRLCGVPSSRAPGQLADLCYLPVPSPRGRNWAAAHPGTDRPQRQQRH